MPGGEEGSRCKQKKVGKELSASVSPERPGVMWPSSGETSPPGNPGKGCRLISHSCT